MAGLAFLGIFLLWGLISFWGIWFLLRKVKSMFFRIVVNIILSIFIFISPVIDEIIGGIKFRVACQENYSFKIDNQKAINSKLRFKSKSKSRRYLPNFIVPVLRDETEYVDVGTGNVVVSWVTLKAEGGWLSSSLLKNLPFLAIIYLVREIFSTEDLSEIFLKCEPE